MSKVYQHKCDKELSNIERRLKQFQEEFQNHERCYSKTSWISDSSVV